MTRKEIVTYLTENYGKGVKNFFDTTWIIDEKGTAVVLPDTGRSLRILKGFYNVSYGFNCLTETFCGVLDKNWVRILF